MADLGLYVRSHCPAHHPARIQVQHHRQVQPAAARADVSDVSHPGLIGPRWVELPFQHVQSPGELRCSLQFPGEEDRCFFRIVPVDDEAAHQRAELEQGMPVPTVACKLRCFDADHFTHTTVADRSLWRSKLSRRAVGPHLGRSCRLRGGHPTRRPARGSVNRTGAVQFRLRLLVVPAAAVTLAPNHQPALELCHLVCHHVPTFVYVGT
jgi:hypothetical protein